LFYFYLVQRQATQRGKYSFQKVKDARGHDVRGLWKRGSRFYAQLRLNDAGKARNAKIPLQATTSAQAIAELETKRTERRKGELVVVTHSPKLVDAVAQYKTSAEYGAKRASTQVNEVGYLKVWLEYLGSVRVDKIQKPHIIAVRDKLKAKELHNRTLNLYVGALLQVLKFCRERGQIKVLPELSRLKQPKNPRRTLVEDAQFQQLLDACRPEVTKNADLFRFYLQFLALTGSREQEALRVRWKDVDFKRKAVTIGSDAKSKNSEARDVNFSPELEKLLAEMHAVRPPECSWLFPSPQRGDKDIHSKTFRETLYLVRKEADLKWIGFHHFRHLFISKCVMAGVDYMTIAAWVGHKDGGVLIGKVYGHLSQDHKASTAHRLSFFAKPANVQNIEEAASA
jgi:integrase